MINESQQLERAMAALEAQRATLGDSAVDAALDGLRQKLAEMNSGKPTPVDNFQPPPENDERKLVTVMFADLSGFTAMSEKLDPEKVRGLVNACFNQMVPVIEKYGGTVEKFIGDEIMALFGAPVANENDPERALRCALELLTTLKAFNQQNSQDLGMHIGINTGRVVSGGIGSEGHLQYGVMGDAVNLAARLEDLSQRGEIFCGPQTYRLTAPVFDFDALEPVSIKGKAELVQVYRLLGLKAKEGSRRGLESQGIYSPMVGREKEFIALQSCLGRLINYQGGVAFLSGEAGMGKSRLVAEVREASQHILGNGTPASSAPLLVRWLEARTLSFGQTISYWPFQEILRSYTGITEEDSEAEAWYKLEQRVSVLFPDNTSEVLPYLASLLTVEVRGEYQASVQYLDGEALGSQIFLTSYLFFEQLARRQPLALVFEDLHWIDASSLELLEHLLPLVRQVPLLVIVTSRPDTESIGSRLRDLMMREYAPFFTDIRLSSLSQMDSVQLVRNLLNIENMSFRIQEMILRKADGNPFFIEEVIRTLIETGVVVSEPTTRRWHATAAIENVNIPDTIQGVIMARVDRLDEQVKSVLRIAAVIGRSFLYRVLRALDEADQELDRHLADLQSVELIHEKQTLPELEFMFKHALVQEATYESILLDKRRELHARTAQVIEKLFADRLEEFYGLLAYHYASAEIREKALDYLLKSGDQAGRMAADTEALNFYQQAMSTYTNAFGDRWDPVQRAILERKMGEAYLRSGDNQRALEYFEKAFSLLGFPLPTTPSAIRLGLVREAARQLMHRLFRRQFVKPLAKEIPLAIKEINHLFNVTFEVDIYNLPERALFFTFLNNNMADTNGLPLELATAGVAFTFDFLCMYKIADHLFHQPLNLINQSTSISSKAMVLEAYGWHKTFSGDLNEGLKSAQQAADIFWSIGDLPSYMNTTNLLIVIHAHKGRLQKALELSLHLLKIGREAGGQLMQVWGYLNLGWVLMRLGRLDEAAASLLEGLTLAKSISNTAFLISMNADLGRCYLRMGQVDEALEAFTTSKKYYEPHLGTDSYLSLRNGQDELYLSQAETCSVTERPTLMKKAKKACREALKQEREFRAGWPEALRLQGVYEWLRGKPAAAQKCWRRSLELSQEMGQPYDEAGAHLEMGQRLNDCAHLEQAVALFESMDARYDLARARGALEKIRARS